MPVFAKAYIGATEISRIYRGASLIFDALGTPRPLVATGNAPESIITTQAADDLDFNASGWISGGVPPYTVEVGGLGDRVSATGGEISDLSVTVSRFGDPIAGESLSLRYADSAGDEVIISMPVTITPVINLVGDEDTLTWTPFDAEEPFTLFRDGESYSSSIEADTNGPVNLDKPSYSGTPSDGNTATAIWGLWQADTAFGAVTLTREFRNANGDVLGSDDTHSVTATDEAEGLYLYERAVQGVFPAREAFIEIIAAAGSQSMALVMDADGIAVGGTPRALTSLPLSMTTDGF